MLADSGTARRQAKPTRQLRRRQPPRQLQQRERVPARFDNDSLQHGLIKPSRQDRLQQGPRITTTQGLKVQLRQTGERVARLSCREQERDLFRQQTTSHERQRARRSVVEPMRVVNDGQQRLLLGRLGQQAEYRQSDQERIWSGPGTKAERDRRARRAEAPGGGP